MNIKHSSVFSTLQVQGFEEARQQFGKTQQYNGMIDCFRVIWIEEGLSGFLKGMSPSILKVRNLSKYDDVDVNHNNNVKFKFKVQVQVY